LLVDSAALVALAITDGGKLHVGPYRWLYAQWRGLKLSIRPRVGGSKTGRLQRSAVHRHGVGRAVECCIFTLSPRHWAWSQRGPKRQFFQELPNLVSTGVKPVEDHDGW